MVDTKPKEARGGTFAPADVKIIKDSLDYYVHYSDTITADDERHIANLLHRLNRIG
jgi:hypothetical protein